MDTIDTDIRLDHIYPRYRKMVLATSASPELVSRESFDQRLEGMNDSSSSSSSSSCSSSSSSSAVVCVNCNKERGPHHHHNNNVNNNSSNNATKRKCFGRHKGKSNNSNTYCNSNNNNNNNNNSNSGNRKKQQHQQAKAYSPIVVHLKDSFRSKRSSRASKIRKASLDVDSDASSSRSTDDDLVVSTTHHHHHHRGSRRRGDDDVFETLSSSDLASSPETVSYLQGNYLHHPQMQPYRLDGYRKLFGSNNQVFSFYKPHQVYGRAGQVTTTGLHKATSDFRPSRKNKNLTAFISELEKAHTKASTKDIEINLSKNAPNAKDPSTPLNNHAHCDCKNEGLNNVCKYLLKDVDEVKRKNVADCDNVDLICNDLFTSSDKLSEESTDESDTSDKASELSSSDALSDDLGGASSTLDISSSSGGSGGRRKISAEALENFVEYATGAPLVQHDCNPSQCLSCVNAAAPSPSTPYPLYYSFYHTGFESRPPHQISRYGNLYDYHGPEHQLFPQYRFVPQFAYQPHPHHHQLPQQQYHPRPPHRRGRHHQQHRQDLRYQLPWQQQPQCNNWIIEVPRFLYNKVGTSSATTTTTPSRDLSDEDIETSSSSSSLSSSPSVSPPPPSAPSSAPPSSSSSSVAAAITTSSNTVVTVCANTTALRSSAAAKAVVPWKQRSKSESDGLGETAEVAITTGTTGTGSVCCPDGGGGGAGRKDKKDSSSSSSSSSVASGSSSSSAATKARRNGFKNRKNAYHSWDAALLESSLSSSQEASMANDVYMEMAGLDAKFSVHYPGDPDHISWPFHQSSSRSQHYTTPSSSLWIPPGVVPSSPSLSPYTIKTAGHTSSFTSSRLLPHSAVSPCSSSSRRQQSSSSLSSSSSSRHPHHSKCQDYHPSSVDCTANVSSIESEMQHYELTMPSSRPWIHCGSMDKDVPAAVFSVMCYNVLSDKLCTKAMYGYCPTWALSWDYRKKGIMNDIINGNADIITLQEVETEQYYNLFTPELGKRGYEGTFLPKSRVRTMNSDKEKMSVDGCAIFYKKAKFEKVNEHHIEFSQLATKDGASNTDTDMINRVSTKDNIAIVAMLRTKPAAYEESPVPAPKGLSQMLMVSTAHIHWDPQLPDVKLVQTIMLVEELRKFIKEASVQFRPNAPPPSVDSSDMCSSFPLILCGDFNSLPDSGVFEYLSKGKLDTRHRDFDGQNYKAFLKDRNENGILNHKFNLTTAYKDDVSFTNYTYDFKGVIDYIFYSGQHVRLHGVMGLQDEEWFRVNKIVGCPHPFVPSDHFPLFAEFSLPVKPAPKPR